MGLKQYVYNSAITVGSKWVETTAGADVPSEVTLGINQQSGTSYSLQSSDVNKLVELSNTSAISVTVPASIGTNGQQIHIIQTNTGQVTVAGASGVTINSSIGLKLRGQWSSATLIKRGTDLWVLVGDTVA